jgi:hypothetical protein
MRYQYQHSKKNQRELVEALTAIAARWMVWGMQRQRASSAEKGIAASLHRDSMHLSIVSLLLALSITNAII